ncbi:MAG: EVE domain-containing protein [Oscillatoriaceae bacterium SKW80]|nr:EVE domain-containing protein [Oscillatoriaceae bacterium SKYG93]MCX8121315.1 EVE domain-containing protein [Oscillatoriaceae bacterium SKW80]MDW8453351.1 EVE domain-containing protein [Oscillatoriaceae cyanobacterium SKYGB_i_bin93]HIK26705.1 EVE domain-containing protein [Oscillatoriaceae cyanobacterium M7585_C2015_266]
MAYWLFKSEPEEYSWADLEREGDGIWDGVKNPLALKHLRAIALADLVLTYHTGKELTSIRRVKTHSSPQS